MLPLRTVAKLQPKEAVRALLDELPDDGTLEEVKYELYFLDLVQRGLAEADAGKLAPHDDVMTDLRRKWRRPSAR
jgi:predicted transcriptional regulator